MLETVERRLRKSKSENGIRCERQGFPADTIWP
jgi:hypothetical protein